MLWRNSFKNTYHVEFHGWYSCMQPPCCHVLSLPRMQHQLQGLCKSLGNLISLISTLCTVICCSNEITLCSVITRTQLDCSALFDPDLTLHLLQPLQPQTQATTCSDLHCWSLSRTSRSYLLIPCLSAVYPSGCRLSRIIFSMASFCCEQCEAVLGKAYTETTLVATVLWHKGGFDMT